MLVCTESGTLSSREMHVLLGAMEKAGAKIVLVGDHQQLQAIGAGPGLDLVSPAVEAAQVDTIVRQREPWAREAIAAFGRGQAAAAIQAFADRGLLIEAQGAKAAIAAVLDAADQVQARDPNASALIVAKSKRRRRGDLARRTRAPQGSGTHKGPRGLLRSGYALASCNQDFIGPGRPDQVPRPRRRTRCRQRHHGDRGRSQRSDRPLWGSKPHPCRGYDRPTGPSGRKNWLERKAEQVRHPRRELSHEL